MINKERVTLFCTGFGLDGYELAQEQHKAGNLTDGEFMAVELFWLVAGSKVINDGIWTMYDVFLPEYAFLKKILRDRIIKMIENIDKHRKSPIWWLSKPIIHFTLESISPNKKAFNLLTDFDKIFIELVDSANFIQKHLQKPA